MNKGYYASRYSYDPRRETTWKSICKFLERYIPQRSVVLDLGCGYCDFINNINASKKYAVDLASFGIKHAKKRVVFKKASSTKLPFNGNFFDVIFCSNLLEHLDWNELNKTIAEIKRVLKPGGTLMIIQPNYKYCISEYFDDYTHKTVFTHLSLKDFLEANKFKVKVCKKRFLPFSVNGVFPIPGILLKLLVNVYIRSPIKPGAKQMFIVAANKK